MGGFWSGVRSESSKGGRGQILEEKDRDDRRSTKDQRPVPKMLCLEARQWMRPQTYNIELGPIDHLWSFRDVFTREMNAHQLQCQTHTALLVTIAYAPKLCDDPNIGFPVVQEIETTIMVFKHYDCYSQK